MPETTVQQKQKQKQKQSGQQQWGQAKDAGRAEIGQQRNQAGRAEMGQQQSAVGRIYGRRALRGMLTALLLFTMIFFAGCSAEEKADLGMDPVEAYMTVLKSLEDPAKYEGTEKLKYISLDIRGMKGTSKEDKERLLVEIAQTYDVEVFTYNEVQLLRKGYLKDNCFVDGILFRLTDTQFEENPVKVKVREWLLNSQGVSDQEFTLEFEQGSWSIVEITKLEKVLS